MQPWLRAALDYIPQWLAFQREHTEQPGVSIAIAERGVIVLEAAFGAADLDTAEPLTPRHRFRVASHSKTFTAAGILKLADAGRLRLDDTAGRWVPGLHPDVARVTLRELLSHSGGITRDGADGGQFMDRRPFLDRQELMADLGRPQPLEPGETFKYSNHGFALAGLVIAAVTEEPYLAWIRREIVAASGLKETEPDPTTGPITPFARGHTTKLPFGRRLVVPGDAAGNAIAPAAAFVSTAADLARFFASLAPDAESSVLSPRSRREMTRRHWRDRHASVERYYGLGTISGPPGDWAWVGHSGSWQGTLSRTAIVPDRGLTLSVIANAIDGPAQAWVDGAIHILQTFERHGAACPATAAWTGRWWNLWGAFDLVPMADRVLVASPGLALPFVDATEIEVSGPSSGRVARAQAFGDLGEPVRCVLGPDGRATELWLGAKMMLLQDAFAAEVTARYGGRV